MKEVVPKFTVQFNEHDDDDDDGTTNLREIVSKHSHSSRSALYGKTGKTETEEPGCDESSHSTVSNCVSVLGVCVLNGVASAHAMLGTQ